MDDESLQKILQFFSLSWSGYRKVRKGVKRRLGRHMLKCECRSVRDYLRLLDEDTEALQAARELVAVPISRFFRDRRLWEVLDNCVIPKLLREADVVGERPVRVWVAGCACGEEVYSLRMVWDLVGRRFASMPRLEIWATDVNPEVLDKARLGVYPQSSLKELPSPLVQDYFVRVSKGFAILDVLKDGIHWLKHDFVFQSPPGETLDLIFLRNNLLTYFEQPVKRRVFVQILAALRSGGFLILGRNERIPVENVPLGPFAECGCIYEKKTDQGIDDT